MRLGACQWPRTPLACSDQTKSWEEPLQPSTSLRKGQPAGRATSADPHDDSPHPQVGHLRSPHPRRSALDVGGGDAGGKAQPTSAPFCHLVRHQRRLTDAECDEVARLCRSLPCSACYRYLAVQGSMLRSMPW